MSLVIVNPLERADWNSWAAGRAGLSFFNSAEWARVLNDTYRFAPLYLADAEAGSPSLLMPLMEVDSWLTGRRGVSLPFSDYCEPVGLGSGGGVEVLNRLREIGKQRAWRHFELRNAEGFDPSIPSSAGYFNHVLDLTPGRDKLFGALESSVRTALRKATKTGVAIEFADSLDALRAFYRLHERTRRKHGLPPQPFGFFRNLHRHVLAKGMGTVVVARHEGTPITASVFCHIGTRALYKYGASDMRFQALRGSTLVMWEAIQWYARQGYASLGLGRTSPSQDGLRRFKRGWGATETSLKYLKYDFPLGRFVGGQAEDMESGVNLTRALPLFVNRLAGSVLYRHMA